MDIFQTKSPAVVHAVEISEDFRSILASKFKEEIYRGNKIFSMETNDEVLSMVSEANEGLEAFCTQHCNIFLVFSSINLTQNCMLMIENINTVGVGTTIKGYNSKDHGYKLFTLNAVTPNIGGIGSVAYNLSNELGEGEIPGEFDSINSSGQIIAQKHFPTFSVELSTGDYLSGEKVTTNGKEGIVQSWDRTTKILRILSSDDFVNGEIIRGLTSELSGVASKVTSYESYFETNVSSQIFSGNQTGSGYFNDNLYNLPFNLNIIKK